MISSSRNWSMIQFLPPKYLLCTIVVGMRLVALPVSTWSQVQAWLKSGKVGNLKIAYAILIKSEVSR